MTDGEQKVASKTWVLKAPVDEQNGPALLELCVPSPFGRGERMMNPCEGASKCLPSAWHRRLISPRKRKVESC